MLLYVRIQHRTAKSEFKMADRCSDALTSVKQYVRRRGARASHCYGDDNLSALSCPKVEL